MRKSKSDPKFGDGQRSWHRNFIGLHVRLFLLLTITVVFLVGLFIDSVIKTTLDEYVDAVESHCRGTVAAMEIIIYLMDHAIIGAFVHMSGD
jgi:hypothetical protein